MNPWWIPDTSLHRYWPESFIIFPPRRHNGAVVVAVLIILQKIIIMSIDRRAGREGNFIFCVRRRAGEYVSDDD